MSKLQDRTCRGPAWKHARTMRAHSLSDRLPGATASNCRALRGGVCRRFLLHCGDVPCLASSPRLPLCCSFSSCLHRGGWQGLAGPKNRLSIRSVTHQGLHNL